MSDEKYLKDDPERTLVTLDQLSQTIEVMTSVVNRLRRHLSEQIKSQLEHQIENQFESQLEALFEAQQIVEEIEPATKTAQKILSANSDKPEPATKAQKESFVVEINQQDAGPLSKTRRVLH